jgi:Tfp pilus assembly protein PilE
MKFTNTLQQQRGVSLIGLMFWGALIAIAFVVGAQVVPSYAEYLEISKAIRTASKAGTTVAEIRASFTKQVEAGYITTVSANDLDITKDGKGDIVVSFAYQKKLPLVGPVSLVIDYEGSTRSR